MTEPMIPTSSPLTAEQAAELDAKQRMVITAAKLFQRQGFHATGMKQIVHEAAAPRGSIYHHFPGGKDELGVQAIGVAARELTRAIQRAIERGDGAADVIRKLGRALERWLRASDYLEGCPVSTVTLETAPTSPSLTEACAAAYREWIELIAGQLRAEGLSDERAEALGIVVVSGIEGALLLCRASTDTSALRTVTDELAAMVESRLAD